MAGIEIYLPPPRSWLQRWLWGIQAERIVEQSPHSLLFLQPSRWPLQHILLVVRAQESDWQTLSWVERLAQPGQTKVSILPIVPPWPRLHRRIESIQLSPEILLAPNTPSGAMVRQMRRQLQQQQISTSVALTTGEPDWRIRTTVAASRPDLMAIAAEPHCRLLRCFTGELVNPLLRWVPCPLLITK